MRDYLFEIPKPSAKRLSHYRQFIVEVVGMVIDPLLVYDIEPGKDFVVWRGPDELEHFDREVLDANYSHRFWVEFSNVIGTRKERIPVTVQDRDDVTDYQVLEHRVVRV